VLAHGPKEEVAVNVSATNRWLEAVFCRGFAQPLPFDANAPAT